MSSYAHYQHGMNQTNVLPYYVLGTAGPQFEHRAPFTQSYAAPYNAYPTPCQTATAHMSGHMNMIETPAVQAAHAWSSMKRQREPELDERYANTKKARNPSRKDLEFDWDRHQLRDPRLTPGRVLPPRRGQRDLTEEEKAFFKGPTPEWLQGKPRLSRADKDKIYEEEIRNNIAHPFHEMHLCYDKGPNGSPTYDQSGFELDYFKVAEWLKPKRVNKNRAQRIRNQDKHLKKLTYDWDRMTALFFIGGQGPSRWENKYVELLIKDKVSKDLGIPFHRIGVAEVEEWARRGFPKENPNAFTDATVTEEEKKRLLFLLQGGSLRK
ncbi:hypothetical protein LTR10_013796 [Elasticomyces elasticus]|nr:hypothetical protein LTR10_013796 [Elasticomyces elasticus]KAK5042274.1 hypothetical protein LTR13_002080 [Exophiala sideris]KAK5185542.1 hypothetical protein LTR44_002531 [Eurotiomycetes sp. CCFEE 6388]